MTNGWHKRELPVNASKKTAVEETARETTVKNGNEKNFEKAPTNIQVRKSGHDEVSAPAL